MSSPIGATSSSSFYAAEETADKSAEDQKTLAEDLDTFLTLLTTQLKYQDPLSPMDSTEFTNQLVQFASVEQQITQNSHLEDLIAIGEANGSALTVSYIGQTIEAETRDLPLQDGQAQFSYALTDEASSVTVAVLDGSGSVVFSTPGETTPGKHGVYWDGTDQYGNALPDGVYEIVTTAFAGEEGQAVDVITTSYGRVTGLTTINGKTTMDMGGVAIDMDKVISVTAPVTNAQANAGT